MKPIEVSFLCVQPIKLTPRLYQKIIQKNIEFKKFDKYSRLDKYIKSSDSWLKNFNNLYDTYSSLYEVNLKNIDSTYLHRDLNNKRFIVKNNANQELNISKFLLSNNYGLFYDARFSYFILIYEINFSFPSQLLEDFLIYDGSEDNHHKEDLYNTIRKLIVKEESHSLLGSWGRYIQSSVISNIKKIIRETFLIKIKEGDISIENNTGNISCFIINKNKNFNKLFIKFNELNKFSERITANYEVIPLYQESLYYSFHGRFHTIYIKKEEDRFRFQPLQFHIQYIWFLISQYNTLMNIINLDIMQNNSLENLKKYVKVINAMINRIELLNLHNNDFKRSIEMDYNEIYQYNEIKWSIPTLLNSSQRYASFFKDYLDRLFQQKNEYIQKKQNNILLSITILQLVALISVWTDYISLLDKKNLNIDKSLSSYFGTADSLLNFNFISPLYILGIIAFIIGYLLLQKKG